MERPYKVLLMTMWFINLKSAVTHDLDFGTLLAATQAESSRVIQVPTQDILPDDLELMLVDVLRQFEPELNSGALIVINKEGSKVGILRLNQRN
jgi:predicted nuclease of predicted toxin-antitoxin system